MLLLLGDLFVGDGVVLLRCRGGGHRASSAETAAASACWKEDATAHKEAGGEDEVPEDGAGGLVGHGGIIGSTRRGVHETSCSP